MPQSMVLLELNELCPSLMYRFMRDGGLPNFERLHNEANVYTTDAQEEAPFLEPWIQWVTVHTGMPYREHQIFRLSDGRLLKHKCIWDILSENGRRVWVCGSMNVRYDRPINGLVLPDPWDAEIGPSNPELNDYLRFVQRNTQEHANKHLHLSVADHARFVAFMLRHGLSLESARAIVRQLASERGGRNRWRRAAILDKLQFDLFAHYFSRLKPHFSTFFLNSVAHFQHLYWRNLEPDLFERKPSAQEQMEYESAILFGYQEMDRLIGRFFGLVGDETTLVLCTGLSQQPCLKYEAQGGRLFYRPRDFGQLLAFAGVRQYAGIVPVMSECFNVRFDSEAAASEAESRLARLRVDGVAALFVERQADSLHAGCRLSNDVPMNARLSLEGEDRSALFSDHFYQVDGIKSGMHHPDGLLWIRQPGRKHAIHLDKIPLTSVAPMILDIFAVPKPQHMQADWTLH